MIEYWNKMFNLDIQIVNLDNNQYEAQLNLKFAANEIPAFYKTSLNNLQKYYDQQVMAEILSDVITENMPYEIIFYVQSQYCKPEIFSKCLGLWVTRIKPLVLQNVKGNDV
jgi:hypothetical protein